MSSISPGAVPRRSHRRWVLVVTALGIFMTFLDATIVNVAFPSIRADFPAAGLPELSWVLNAYNAVIAAVLLPAGRLADLLGRRRVFLVGLAVFVIGSLLCGVASSVLALIAARVLQASGAGIIVPASLALLLSAFHAERRATAVALWGAAAAVAAAIGPTLGGLLVESASWRLVFLVNLPISAPGSSAGASSSNTPTRHRARSRTPSDSRARQPPWGCLPWASSRATTGAGTIPLSSARSLLHSSSPDWSPCAPGTIPPPWSTRRCYANLPRRRRTSGPSRSRAASTP